MNQATLAASLCLAFWPTIVWLVQRTFDHSDEPWGLLSLATVIFLVVAGPRLQPGRNTSSSTGGILEPLQASEALQPLQPLQPLQAVAGLFGILVLVIHLLTWQSAPQMVHAVLFVLAIGCFLITRLPVLSKEGLFGLLLLALPVMPSVNFYCGYPVRAAVAFGARLSLSCLGLPVLQEGTVLSIRKQLFAIDVPCSGIHMLWVEDYAVMLLAYLFRLNLKKTTLLTLAACFLIPIGNIFRATTLILFDLVRAQPPAFSLSQFEPVFHTLIGLFVFVMSTAAVGAFARYLSNWDDSKVRAIANDEVTTSASNIACVGAPSKRPSERLALNNLLPRLSPGNFRRVQLSVLVLSVTGAALPFLAHPTTGAAIVDPPTVWPNRIDGAKIISVDSLQEEQAFAADFPGRMKRFTDGTNSYFVRCVYRDTRQLHPSSDCFRGLGYAVESRPIVVGTDGKRWSSFDAEKSGHRYFIMERIFNDQGDSWTDVSEWYWSACLGKSKGPWFAVTIAKPQETARQP